MTANNKPTDKALRSITSKRKSCINCYENKPHMEFPKLKTMADNLSPYCKPCNGKRTYQYKLKKMIRDGHNVNTIKSCSECDAYYRIVVGHGGKCKDCK